MNVKTRSSVDGPLANLLLALNTFIILPSPSKGSSNHTPFSAYSPSFGRPYPTQRAGQCKMIIPSESVDKPDYRFKRGSKLAVSREASRDNTQQNNRHNNH